MIDELENKDWMLTLKVDNVAQLKHAFVSFLTVQYRDRNIL
jgi:hypothetical protein